MAGWNETNFNCAHGFDHCDGGSGSPSSGRPGLIGVFSAISSAITTRRAFPPKDGNRKLTTKERSSRRGEGVSELKSEPQKSSARPPQSVINCPLLRALRVLCGLQKIRPAREGPA